MVIVQLSSFGGTQFCKVPSEQGLISRGCIYGDVRCHVNRENDRLITPLEKFSIWLSLVKICHFLA